MTMAGDLLEDPRVQAALEKGRQEIYKEFNIFWGDGEGFDRMADEIMGLRLWRAWAIRTRCGDVMEWERLIPASGGKKQIPKRHFNDN
jgi:hypothetical protein